MSALRQAAQQALQAMSSFENGTGGLYEGEFSAEIAALRAALAEPDLSHCPQCGGPADNGHDRSIPPSPYWCTKCMAEPVQEPVAWKDKTYESLYHQDFGNSIPLYTAPPQRKPLTEEEIEKAYREIWSDLPSDFDHTSAGWIEMGIKYAERAHGIT